MAGRLPVDKYKRGPVVIHIPTAAPLQLEEDSPSPPETNLLEDLMSLYLFNGNTDDSSGNNRDWYDPGLVEYLPGLEGESLSHELNGILTTEPYSETTPKTSFTIVFWTKWQTDSENNPDVKAQLDYHQTSFGGSTGSFYLQTFRYSGASDEGWVYANHNGTSLSSDITEVIEGSWNMAGVTDDGTIMKLYFNGQEVASGDSNGTITDDGTSYINWLFNHKMPTDQLAFWGRALSAAEMSELAADPSLLIP